MLTYRDFKVAFRDLDLGLHSRVIVHASLQAFEPVAGGAGSIVGALLSTVEMVLTPTFTTRTMVTPAMGPPDRTHVMNFGQAMLTSWIYHAEPEPMVVWFDEADRVRMKSANCLVPTLVPH